MSDDESSVAEMIDFVRSQTSGLGEQIRLAEIGGAWLRKKHPGSAWSFDEQLVMGYAMVCENGHEDVSS